MKVEKLLVAGAGQMGAGIAQVAAQAGMRVVLTDVADEFIARGIAAIEKNLGRQVDKGKLEPAAREQALAAITTSLTLDAGRDADLFIEAAPEVLEIKQGLFAAADALLRDEAIIATNTSSLSVTKLATFTKRPDRFVGIHFFNPVPAMALVEVVRGLETADETVAAARAFAEAVGKTPITVADSPGFVANRILFPMINEAVFALYEGVASAEEIDAGMKLGSQPPHGPAGAGRPRRARHDAGHHRDALPRPRRSQVPPLPTAASLRRRRQAGTQDRLGVLRVRALRRSGGATGRERARDVGPTA